MKVELDKKLCTKYPKIFINRHGDMKTTAMCWGFECMDGWYWLIDRLCSNLQWNTDHNNRDGRYPQVVAVQVKEKFGELRFYVENATEAQYAVISYTETLSNYICESCGSMENIGHTQGYISTLCEKCKDKSRYIWIKDEEDDKKSM